MPARHLGFSNGSAASVTGIIISLDFLLPFAARSSSRPARSFRHVRRGYASGASASAAVEVEQEGNAQAGPSRLSSPLRSQREDPSMTGCCVEATAQARSRTTGENFGRASDSTGGHLHQPNRSHASTIVHEPHKPPDPPGTPHRASTVERTTSTHRHDTNLSQNKTTHGDVSPALPIETSPHLSTHHRSFVHKYLDRDSPPSPTFLRDHLRARPSFINSQALTALASLADRTGHEGIAKNVRLARRKVDGQYWIRPDQSPSRRQATDDSTAPWRWKGLKPHGWARDNWPPEQITQPLNMAETMRDLHFRILCASSKRPASTLAQAVGVVLEMCKSEKRGPRGRLEALSGVLHLYVIYAPHLPGGQNGMEVMEEGLALCPELRPDKQTLHLLVQQLIWPRLLEYPPTDATDTGVDAEAEDLDQASSDADNKRPRPRPRIPNDDPQTITKLLHLLTTLHRVYGLTPGTETFRHLLTFAALTDNRMLGDLAVRGYALASKEPARRTPGEGDLAKWHHSGTRRKKWRDLVRSLKHQGWLSEEQAQSALRVSSGSESQVPLSLESESAPNTPSAEEANLGEFAARTRPGETELAEVVQGPSIGNGHPRAVGTGS
ncbi:hypothetical protein DB88DRAFT_476614 [Papiliotrema laurentii]|uniref:Uncharacterized protein n=1 Tax=Papiliotrema laurentii TaxID=5418 RepID=A0AAD9FVL0_PAPLA|nr:hypothetical protein DB88DRAFT_476614 [Papiliotrema laurentii]